MDSAFNVSRFDESIERQIAENAARSPSGRFVELCRLLDAARQLAPSDAESRARRERIMAVRERDRERMRGYLRQFIAADGDRADPCI